MQKKKSFKMGRERPNPKLTHKLKILMVANPLEIPEKCKIQTAKSKETPKSNKLPIPHHIPRQLAFPKFIQFILLGRRCISCVGKPHTTRHQAIPAENCSEFFGPCVEPLKQKTRMPSLMRGLEGEPGTVVGRGHMLTLTRDRSVRPKVFGVLAIPSSTVRGWIP